MLTGSLNCSLRTSINQKMRGALGVKMTHRKAEALRRLASGLFISATTTLLAVLAVEVSMRVVLPADFMDAGQFKGLMMKDAGLGWKPRPNLAMTWTSRYGSTTLATNADGLMPASATRTRLRGVTRILLLGDSTVMGKSVPESARLHRQLQEQLGRAGMPAEVINAAAEGWATDQSLLRLIELIDLYRPDMVIYGFCLNDLHGNTTGFDNASKPRFVMEVSGALRLIPADDRPLEDHAANILYRYSAAYRYFQPTIFAIRAKLGLVSDSAAFAPEPFWTDDAFLDSRDWRLFWRLLVEIRNRAAARQIAFLFYAHPSAEEVWPPSIKSHLHQLGHAPERHDPYRVERRLAAGAVEAGVSFVPMVNYFRERTSEGPFHLLPRDPHSNHVGYGLIAAKLSEAITREAQLSPAAVLPR